MFWDTKPQRVIGEIHSDVEILRDLPTNKGAFLAFWPTEMEDVTCPMLVWHRLPDKGMMYLLYRVFQHLLAIDRSWLAVIHKLVEEVALDREHVLEELRTQALAQQKALEKNPITDI